MTAGADNNDSANGGASREIELLDSGDSSTDSTQVSGSISTDSRSNTLAIVLAAALLGWLALALFWPGGDANLATAPDTTTTVPAEVTTTTLVTPDDSALLEDSALAEEASQETAETANEISLEPVASLAGFEALVAVTGASQSIWHVDLGSGDSTRVETPVHVTRPGDDEIHFLDGNRFLLTTGPRTSFTLFQIDDGFSGGVEQLFTFGSVGLGVGERGLDRENHGLWVATRFGLTRWDYEGDQVQVRWNDPDSNFDLNPMVRGSSSAGLLLEAPTGGDYWVDNDGLVKRLPDGRIEAVAGPWVAMSQCDDSLNCEGMKLLNLLTGTEADLGGWRRLTYGCSLGYDDRFTAVGIDLNGRLTLVTYDAATATVTNTDLESGALGCVALSEPAPDTYVMAFEKGVAVFTGDGTWVGASNTRPLGGDVVAAQPTSTP